MSPSEQETRAQRVNRELIELLNEIRVVLPGVQVLLAFLLAVPFQQRFGELSGLQREIYFATVVLTLITTVLLIAPSSFHRLNFRRRRKDQILFVANRLMIAGTFLLSLSLTGVVILIASVLYGTAATIATGAGAFAVMAWFWYGLPLSRRRTMSSEEVEAGDEPLLRRSPSRRKDRG